MINGFEGLRRKISTWARKFPEASMRGFKNASPGLIRLIRAQYLSGQVLGVRTGNLKASIRTIIQKLPMRASMLVGTDVQSDRGFYYGGYWYRKGRDFLKPAIREDISRIGQLVANEIMAAWPKDAG